MDISAHYPILCLIVDRGGFPNLSLEQKIHLAVKGGVNMVQLREKHLASTSLLELCSRMIRITDGKSLFMVNGNVNVALASGADGVQLGEHGDDITETKSKLEGRLLLGCSTHTLEDSLRAEELGADFLVVGTIFESDSHVGVRPSGVGLLKSIDAALDIPFIGIGGINASNAGNVIMSGASGVAVRGAILNSEDPFTAAKAIKQTIEDTWWIRDKR